MIRTRRKTQLRVGEGIVPLSHVPSHSRGIVRLLQPTELPSS